MTFRNHLKLPMQGPQRILNPLGAFVIWLIIIVAVFAPFWDVIYPIS